MMLGAENDGRGVFGFFFLCGSKEKQSNSLTGDFIGKDGVEDFTLLDLLVAAHISIVSPSGMILR